MIYYIGTIGFGAVLLAFIWRKEIIEFLDELLGEFE